MLVKPLVKARTGIGSCLPHHPSQTLTCSKGLSETSQLPRHHTVLRGEVSTGGHVVVLQVGMGVELLVALPNGSNAAHGWGIGWPLCAPAGAEAAAFIVSSSCGSGRRNVLIGPNQIRAARAPGSGAPCREDGNRCYFSHYPPPCLYPQLQCTGQGELGVNHSRDL